MSNIPQWQDLGNEPMTKREQIAALMMHAQISKPSQGKMFTPNIDAARAVTSTDALLAELKRRKEPQ